MVHWLGATLGRKFAFALGGGLLAASVALLFLFVALYQSRLTAERALASDQVNRLFEASLENAMLKRDLDGLGGILQSLGRQDGVRSVMIATPDGLVRFASPQTLLGTTVAAPADSQTVFTEVDGSGNILRSIRRVRNKPACEQCHGPVASNPINGILIVDWDASQIREQARNTALFLSLSGGTVVVAAVFCTWLLVRLLVLRRLRMLGDVARKITANDLAVQAPVHGSDEIDQLARTYNHMLEMIRGHVDELRRRQQFLQSLIDAIPDGVRVLDRQGTILMVNRAYCRQLGLAEDTVVVGTPCHLSSHCSVDPCSRTMVVCPLVELTPANPVVKVVHAHRRTDGSTFEVEVFAALLQAADKDYVVESIRDLAAHVRFGHEQKLSAVGQLAAGVAHEIGNPLASIRLALQGVLKGRLDAEVGHYLRLVDGQIDKCIEVTGRLLRLAGGAAQQRQLFAANAAVTETLSLLAYQAELLRITVTLDLHPAEPRLLMVDGDFRMVLLNLVQNAFHAMPQGGELHVVTEEADGQFRLTVQDTGVGIAAADHLRIFEPFFSKRADGQTGSGLGLAICRSIVDENGGSIKVSSAVGAGATFVVTLPSALSTMTLQTAEHANEQEVTYH